MKKDAGDPMLDAQQIGLSVSRRQALATLGKVGLGGLAASAALQLGGPDVLAAGRTAARTARHTSKLARHNYRFVFVNHVTSNTFFTPTQYGAADACDILGCSYLWTGSATADVGEMTRAVQTAVNGKADGIAVAIVDSFAFDGPVLNALDKGIPVVSYNSDSATNPRFAYIGQELFVSGQGMGKRIVRAVPAGGHVALFIATPGALNIQPRIDGAIDILKKSGRNISYEVVTTGALVAHEIATVESYYLAHKNVNGLFAVDGGSTAGIAITSKKHGLQKHGVGTGGFDLFPDTISGIKSGDMGFTIDQQPYLQGFYPVLQLFLYNASNTLMFPSDSNTGLKFVTKYTVQPYLSTSRFEGTAK